MASLSLALLTTLPTRRAITAGVAALVAPPAKVAATVIPALAFAAPDTGMTDPIFSAIAAHREAWSTFQVAPDDEASEAEDAEYEAVMKLLGTACASQAGALALVAHLRWYVEEEKDNLLTAGLGGCHLGAQLSARLSELVMFLGMAPAVTPAPMLALPAPRRSSPLLAAIEDHRSANLAMSQAVRDYVKAEADSDPDEAHLLAVADRASDVEAAALNALAALTPANAEEVRTLAAYFAEVAADLDKYAFGTWLLQRLTIMIARAQA